MAKDLIVRILADAKQFGAELDKAAGKTRQMSKAAGVAGIAIAGGLAVGLEKSVKAAEDAQVSTAKLSSAFKASHDNIGKYTAAIDGAESSGRNLGFSNIDIRDSLGSLEVATHNGSKAIKDLGVAEDIARFKHISLADASKTLTMTMAGSTRAAHMLGIQTQSVTTAEDKVRAAFKNHSGAAYTAALATAKLSDKQATAAAVVDLVSHKLHGQAQAFADTAQGGAARFHAQLEALEENLGAALLPVITKVTNAIADMTGYFAKHTTAAKVLTIAMAALAAVLIGITSPITAIILGVTALGVALGLAWAKSDEFRKITLAAWQAISDWSKQNWPAIKQIVVTSVRDAWQVVKTVIEVFKAGWREFGGTIKTIVRNDFEAVKGTIQGVVQVIRGVVDIIKGIAHGDWAEVWKGIKEVVGGAFGAMEAILRLAIKNFAAIMSAIGHGMAQAFLGAMKGVEAALKAGFDGAFIAPINAIIDLIDSIKLPAVGFTIFGHHVGFGGWGGFKIPHIPMLAEGGIINSPTLAMIGEAGPEAVIPLKDGGLGGNEIHVHVGPIYGTVDAEFARLLADKLALQLRGGRSPQLQQAIHAL